MARRLHHVSALVAYPAISLVHRFRFHVAICTSIFVAAMTIAACGCVTSYEGRHVHILAAFLLEGLQVSLDRIKQQLLLLDVSRPAVRLVIHAANYSVNIIEFVH